MAEGDMPRVWLKAFWGFDPANDGYLGFTRPADRERFIALFSPGDLVLIYGADTAETARSDRRQALGFLKVEPTPIADVDRMSEYAQHRKLSNGWQDRWKHAVPVRQAWRVKRRIEAKHIAPDTYKHERARLIASRGELLNPHESATALTLPVSPASVFGEPPVLSEDSEFTLNKSFSPSRGIT